MGRCLRTLAAATLGLLASACGGGGGGGGSQDLSSVLILSATPAVLSGYATDTDLHGRGLSLIVGDLDGTHGSAQGYRGFVSFDISSLPANATVQSARLRLYQATVTPVDPYQTHGVVVASHVDYGALLVFDEYGDAPITFNVGTVSSSAAIGWNELNVASSVQADLGTRTRTQFRLEFTVFDSNDDGIDQRVQFEGPSNLEGSGGTPELIVRYTTP